MEYDILIRNGNVIDGSGNKAYIADILIKDGKIVEIGNFKENQIKAKQILDARGYVVTPGFIDIHRHADAAVYRKGFGEAELKQGITTIINGNCGLSIAPVNGDYRKEINSYLKPITGEISADIPTASMKEYLDGIKDIPINTGMLVGAGVLRAGAAGYKLTRLEESHYIEIHNNMDKALEEGALGVSLGLGYAPECFYSTEELIRALEPLRASEIPITVHMRQEGSAVNESVSEMIEVAKALNCHIHISHLKAMGKKNWGRRIPEALKQIEAAAAMGVKIDCDVYPYTAGSTQLMHILPPDYLEGGIDAITARLKDPFAVKELDDRINERSKPNGCEFDNIAALAGWDGIYLSTINSEKNRIYQGKNLKEIALMRGSTELEACCELLAEERCQITMIDFMASEEDISDILNHPLSNLISDSTYPTDGKLHPRVYGTFTHLLEHFVKSKNIMSIEKAIMKMTSAPAKALKLGFKGEIKTGFDADLCIFRLDDIHENATYDNPSRYSEGMKYVLVNGTVALENGELTGNKSGKTIKRT